MGQLQRKCACGNEYTGLAGECGACQRRKSFGLQPKLEVGATSDPLEHEADRVADHLLAAPIPPEVKAARPHIQRFTRPAGARPESAPASVDHALASPGQPLETTLRADMERRFGHDFSRVRVHTGKAAEESARDVSALAYTVGDHVVFAADRYRPADAGGRRLLAHELVHVVQQSAPGVAAPADARAPAAQAGRAEAGPPIHHRERPGLQRQPASAAVAPRTPSQSEMNLIESARAGAANRTELAAMRVGGVVPPGPPDRPDPAAEMRRRAFHLAQLMFQWKNPNMEQVGRIVSSMVTYLISPRVMVAQPGDSECGNRHAYVRGLAPPMILCPPFFSGTPEQRIRTMIHEAAHLAGIGNAALGESYCVYFDCVDSCGGFDSADSWAHFVHCLTDQAVDVPEAVEGRAPGGAAAREAPPAAVTATRKVDLAGIADRVHEAMEGWGTDEEGVYSALQELDRDPKAIGELMKVYQARHHASLIEDIEDDFSGSELEYALQLLNMGHAGSEQRIEREWTTLSDVRSAAERIREAVEGAGTDEEAIFAALLPFKHDTLLLQRAYNDLYREDLRERLVDEMSGSELEYALSLLETPYERLVQDANQRLAGAPFGTFGDVTMFCGPEERETSGGLERTYWYDREFWEHDFDAETKACKVRLLPGKSAAKAIDAMFDHQDRWKISCSEFVQIAHLYALRHSLGARRFDATVGAGGFTLEIKRRASTGLQTEVTFTRAKRDEAMRRSDTGEVDPRSVDGILATAPIGSRVRWTNRDPRAQGTAWQNENTLKLGPDRFGAHGTATGLFAKDNTHTREEVERLTARGTNPDADSAYVAANIFISEIEIFRSPGGAQ